MYRQDELHEWIVNWLIESVYNNVFYCKIKQFYGLFSASIFERRALMNKPGRGGTIKSGGRGGRGGGSGTRGK